MRLACNSLTALQPIPTNYSVMRFVQRRATFRSREDFLHWSNRIRIDNYHPHMPRLDARRKLLAEFVGRAHSLGGESERASDFHKIRTLQLNTHGPSFELSLLYIPQNSVLRIIQE